MSTERILIVEDNGIAAMGLESTITRLGYQSVGIAFSADEAVAMALKERPNLILMDIKLKGERDGINAVDEIHKHCDIPAVYITAFSDLQTLDRAKISAPFGYLMKPYREESVKTTIEIALNSFRLGKKLRGAAQDFRTLFEMSPMGTLLVSEDGTVAKTNFAFSKLMGFAPGEIPEGKSLESFFAEQDQKNIASHNTELFLKGSQHTGEYLAKLNNGTPLWLFLQSALVHEAISGTPMGLYVATDISAQKEVIESNLKLQDFTSLASHDLKAPARMTGAYVSLLAREYGDKLDDRGRKYLGIAMSESKRMQAIVDDLLEYTRLYHAASEWNPISLEKTVSDTLSSIGLEIEEKRAVVTCERLPTIVGNEVQLRRLFGNLLSNAIKFTRSEPRVHIAAAETQEEYIISIKDNGIGIPNSQMADIFEMFHRGHGQSEFPGTGVGLASCKKVMENHQGRIWATSSESEGSTFYLAFPRRVSGFGPRTVPGDLSRQVW